MKPSARLLPSVVRFGAGLTLALGLAWLAAWLAGGEPFAVLRALLLSSLGSPARFGQTLGSFAPLLLCASALMLGFAAGLWNIGAEGQVSFGALSALWALRLAGETSGAYGIALGLLAGLAGGGLWALLTGMLKLYGRVHEIFCGLGLNFVAQGLCLWLVFGPWKRPGVASMSGTQPLAQALWLPRYPGLYFSPLQLGLSVLAFILVCFILRRSRFGLILYALGQNPAAAEILGLSPRCRLLQCLGLCGALAGLAGALQVVGVYHQLIPAISSGYGYAGIMAALLCAGRLAWLPLVCLFFAVVNVGSLQLPLALRLDSSLGGVMQGALVLAFFLVWGLAGKLKRRKVGA